MARDINEFMDKVRADNRAEPEFHQAVHEVALSLWPFIQANAKYRDARLLERMVEPERVVMFRVPWVDDQGAVQVNRGYRVGMSSAIGPYKGGLRFHPTVYLGLLKFLAFEQVFKNSLTTLPLGGGKGGSNFNPKGRSDGEVMRFCQSFMTGLWRHIGADTDVPAGDIGVGGREIGFLFGQYKRLANNFTGVLTGKGLNWGGSQIRPEATGYGAVYFTEDMFNERSDSLRNKRVAISGSGNVAQYACEKATQLGATVVTLSDSSGTVHDPAGIDAEKLTWIMELKNVRRGRIREYAEHHKGVEYLEGAKPWGIPVQVALPCATQNELLAADAETLIKNGCVAVAEGANMPTDMAGIDAFREAKIMFAPGKAANAGGVATSGLEMSQNSQRLSWTREEVDGKLRGIMRSIHSQCVRWGRGDDGSVDYVNGANIAGFVKVADAMLDQGVV